MAELTDPTPAMVSFQQVVRDGEIALQRAALDRDVFVHMDKTPDGESRFAYGGHRRGCSKSYAKDGVAKNPRKSRLRKH
jgi:hypothetical protein